MAILAIAAADRFGRRDDAGPDRGRRALRDGLPVEGGLRPAALAGVDLRDHRLDDRRRHVAAKLGLDAAGMHRRRAHAARFVAPVELDGEQDIGGLGAAIGAELGIGRALEIRIVQIDVGKAMAGGGEVHQPRARLQQRGDPVDQHEMAQMIGAELRLEPIRRVCPLGRP